MLRLHLFVALVHQGGEDVEEVLVEAVPVLPGLPQVGLDEGRHHYYKGHYHYTITSGGSICLSEAGNVIGRRKLPDTVHWCHHPLAQHFVVMTSLNPFNC